MPTKVAGVNCDKDVSIETVHLPNTARHILRTRFVTNATASGVESDYGKTQTSESARHDLLCRPRESISLEGPSNRK